MTTAVAVSRGLPAVPDRAVLPPLSPEILQGLWLIGAGQPPPESTKSEATNLLSVGGAMLGEAKPAQIKNWLLRVNLGASQPISPTDFDIRAGIIVDALREYPAAAFTAETAREAVRNFKWFPGGQELAEFLGPQIRRIREFERDLRRVAYCTLTVPTPRPEPTQEERDAVTAIVGSMTKRGNPQPPARTVEEQLEALRS